MPAKMVARSTEMKVKAAEAVPAFESASKVRGSEQSQQIMVTTMEKTTVLQTTGSDSVIVLRYLAPTRTCRA